MKKTNTNRSECVTENIAPGDIPVSSELKVIRSDDPDLELSDDEISERNEFIAWYMAKDFADLLLIPAPEHEDFFFPDATVDDADYSAFNSIDFHRQREPFDKYAYAMKKVMERIKDLAILHSVISFEEDRKQVFARFRSVLGYHFGGELEELLCRLPHVVDNQKRLSMTKKIAGIRRKIAECESVWEQFSAPDLYPFFI